MDREQMRELVRSELEHIPKGDIDQNLLRATYEQARLNNLGGKSQVAGTRGDVMRFSIAQVRRSSPNATLTYDAAIFV